MEIHARKLHALLPMESFSKSVIIYAFQKNPLRSFDKNEFCFMPKYGKTWNDSRYGVPMNHG